MNIGNTIKSLRKEKKLNQTIFSKMCGLSQTTLSKIESGVSRPNQSTLETICIKLEVPEYLLYLLSVEESDVPTEKKDEFNKMFPTIKDLMIKLFYDEEI